MSEIKNLPQNEEEISRDWHPNYVQYTEMIVNHPNYRGLPFERDKKTNRVKWVVTGKSEQGQARKAWWDEQCRKYHVPIQQGCYAIVARIIHPTGMHVCQCCGKSLSIFYIYPTKTTIKNLQNKLPLFKRVGQVAPADYSIYDIIDLFCRNLVEVNFVATALGLPAVSSKDQLKLDIHDKLSFGNTKRLSPGVMSNPPDRLEGFHSDGLCCREKSDKGRNPDNMKTYTQDRRAYEDWADGNYRLANRLMGEFDKGETLYQCPRCHEMKKMTADHIGPISLGFCHSGHFAPLCQSCNSSKNNRFTKGDVDILLQLERKGEQVISWHAKAIWDLLKDKIIDDRTSILASHLMSEYHQNVLCALAIIHKHGGTQFLMGYLHPEFSLYDYRFENFNPFHLDRMRVIETPIDSKNARKNQERYIRVAFESLEDFLQKENRRHELYFDEETRELKTIAKLARDGEYKEADKSLRALFARMAQFIVNKKWSA